MSKTRFFSFINRILPWIILLSGVLLRLIYLGQIPGGYHRDEAYGAWNAYSLYHDGIDSSGHSYPVYFEAWGHGQNALNSYLCLPLLALTDGRMSTLIIRIPQFVTAVLTLAAVYFLLKKLFSRETALWGMFLLAICPWHVMMSRWGLESNLAPGFLIIGLCFFVYGLEKPAILLLSALFYGLSLYCYAAVWPIVPVMLLLQIIYGVKLHKLKMNRWSATALGILAALALPLLLFLLVNMGYLPEMKIGCFSIYRMNSFRSGEIAGSLKQVWENIKNTGYLLKNQDVGRVYDVIMPYGFFYNIGRLFIVIGFIAVAVRAAKGLVKKRPAPDWLIIIQLVGAGIIGCMLAVNVTQINCLYIPLVICEALGVQALIAGVKYLCQKFLQGKFMNGIKWGMISVAAIFFLVNLAGFQKAYYGEYRELVSANFQEGSDAAVKYAMEQANANSMTVYINDGLKYPNVLLAAEISAAEYQDTLVYSDSLPAPSQFSKETVTFYMGIDYVYIKNQIYVLYYTDISLFEGFEFTQFGDWYVAVPEKENANG